MTENATVRVAERTPWGCGTDTRLAGLGAAAVCSGSTSVTACTGLIIPAPVCAPVPPAAVAMIRCTTCAALSPGCAARTSAASPDTNAAAKLVPLFADLNPPG